MAVSKVILNGTTLIDTTDKTVTPGTMLSGVTALKNDGTTATGTYVPPTFSAESLNVTPSDESQIFDGYTEVYTINTGTYSQAYQGSTKFGWRLTPAPELIEGTTYRVTGKFSYGSVNVTVDGEWEYTLTQSGSYKYSNTMPFTSTPSGTAWVGIEVLSGGVYFAFTSNSSISATSATVLEKIVISKKTIDGYLPVTVEAMPSGTAGTPTATKGTVSNHSVSVTPSVTNTTGYISGGTKNGTAVTVSASELVSGTKSITENGTGIDVTNYAAVDVAVSGGSGGASNVVTGTFTPNAEDAGTSQDISIPYSGNGYPISIFITPADGAWDSSGTLYNTSAQYGFVLWAMAKSVMIAPTYAANDSSDYGTTIYKYKNSSSTTYAVANGGGQSNFLYDSAGAGTAGATSVVFKSATTFSYKVRGTSYGFIPNIEYRYTIMYSQ